ncbi:MULTISPECIES: RidA family protein [unclassified Rhizobium]|uniref:RidA family protein n=1 Tax=unclassified Rhizobium TaxID=2613769 RepID=UPI001A99ECD2|nr:MULTISPECIES: RidA family protein [unclassified Rhizobium]MBX5173332.1 RidA family protein [Rhizobium sp. NZLR1b]MBX5192601.1 RidA family protein [Rhizobium sp. NZLR3b]MBX5204088.1 RidA family protein [Rhizobium sp. NZLR1]QSZ25119.1 RidA family protein [Rhizobium sp. NZLR1]
MLTAVNPPGSAWPGVSQGVILKGSGVFVSTGHVGTDAAGEIIVSSPEDQIVALFDNLRATLTAAGLEFGNVARMTCYVKSFDETTMATLRSVRARYWNQDCPPSSVIVQAALYDPRLLVEAEVLAVVP